MILREQRVILREHYYNSLGSNTNLRFSLARANLTTSTLPWPAKARLLQHQTKTELPKIIRTVSAKLPHASRLRYLQQLAEEGDFQMQGLVETPRAPHSAATATASGDKQAGDLRQKKKRKPMADKQHCRQLLRTWGSLWI